MTSQTSLIVQLFVLVKCNEACIMANTLLREGVVNIIDLWQHFIYIFIYFNIYLFVCFFIYLFFFIFLYFFFKVIIIAVNIFFSIWLKLIIGLSVNEMMVVGLIIHNISHAGTCSYHFGQGLVNKPYTEAHRGNLAKVHLAEFYKAINEVFKHQYNRSNEGIIHYYAVINKLLILILK